MWTLANTNTAPTFARNWWSTCQATARRCLLRSGLTTRTAGAIGRPAEPGSFRQSPRTARQSRSHPSPDGLRRGPRQEPIPEEKKHKERQRSLNDFKSSVIANVFLTLWLRMEKKNTQNVNIQNYGNYWHRKVATTIRKCFVWWLKVTANDSDEKHWTHSKDKQEWL